MEFGLGLAPIAMAAGRDHLPAERVPAAIGLLSVSGATGVGAGYPISGLVAERFDVHVAFYLGAVLSAAALVAVFVAIPRSRATATVPLDVPGALVGGLGVVALLIGVGQGAEWAALVAVVLAPQGGEGAPSAAQERAARDDAELASGGSRRVSRAKPRSLNPSPFHACDGRVKMCL